MVQLAQILIVDDQAHYRHLVSRALHEDGYDTNIVDSADSIWKVLNGVHPDVVLLHAFSKGFDSFDLLLEIKKIAPEFPVLIYAIQSRDAIDKLKESISLVLNENRNADSPIRSNLIRSGGYWINATTRSNASMVEN
jgi:DNA-binding NtrC family response regulator